MVWTFTLKSSNLGIKLGVCLSSMKEIRSFSTCAHRESPSVLRI